MWSSIVSRALDRIGASNSMRKRYYEYNMIQCIGNVFLNLNEDGVYQEVTVNTQRFGSFIEGTTTVGMGSDIDEIDIEVNDVIEHGKEGAHVTNKTVIVVTDMFTPPGFVKLKVNEAGRYIDFILDKDLNGNVYLSNIYKDDYKEHMATLLQVGQTPTDIEKHGPALTNFNEPTNQIESVDAIIAFHCKSGLSFNQEYFRRTRRFGWPCKSTLALMKSQGCLLVPTGHSQCDEKNRSLQWRISFSFQERHLMLNLNSAQYKCYVLLKLVKKSFISPVVGLTSYHCKTALFYSIENTPNDDWREDNLLNCLILCLKRLKRWSKRYNCPNYFLPELNLFTGKIKTKDVYKLTNILSSIIQNPQHYLRHVSTDNFGKLLKFYADESPDDTDIEKEVDRNVAKKLHKLLVDASNSVFHLRSIILQKISYKCKNVETIIGRHCKWLNTIDSLANSGKVGQYSLDGIPWVMPHVKRFLHSSLASHLAIKATETNNPCQKSWYIITATYHFWMGLKSDAMSGKLKLATFLLFIGQLSFEKLRSSHWPTVETQSLCDCTTNVRGNLIRENEYEPFTNMFLSCRQNTLQMSTSHFIEKYVSACSIFLPSESKITLYPLQFEMHRSFGCTILPYDEFLQSTYKMSNCEFDNCATLDSKIYWILLDIFTSNERERKERVRMLHIFSMFDNLAHRETTLNVLGWLASAREINQSSVLFYQESWKYNAILQKFKLPALQTKEKNAAKWHLALHLFRAWNARNQ